MASIKYKDSTTGQMTTVSVKVGDTLPVGTEVDFDGSTIPAGWEEVDDPNEYSTDEIRVGTWMGKPLYRKCFSYTGNITNNTSFKHNISNVDKTIKIYGYFINGNVQGLIPFNNANTQYIIDIDSVTPTGFIWSVGSGFNLSNIPIVLVIEYTKTTD